MNMNGWTSKQIKELCAKIEQIVPQDGEFDQFTYLDIGCVDNKTKRIVDPKTIKSKDAPSRARQLTQDGDIVFSTVRTYLRNIALVPEIHGKIISSTGFVVLRPLDVLNKKYLFYYLLTDELINAINKKQIGTSYPAIRKNDLLDYEIRYPESIARQQLIVDELDKQFTRLDATINSLQAVKKKLDVYRKSVLKAAFEGKMCREQPAIHGPSMFSDFMIPRSWKWDVLSTLSKSMKNGIYKPKSYYSDKGTICLRMYNIEDGRIKLFNLKRMTLSNSDINEYQLQENDILVNRVNSRELVGKAAVIPSHNEPWVYESKNIRLRIKWDIANSKFVSYWFLLSGNRFFNRNAQQTVGMASINQKQLGNLPIPYVEKDKQESIIQEIESRFSVIDKLEETVEKSLTRAELLRKSILKSAFEGKLVNMAGEA